MLPPTNSSSMSTNMHYLYTAPSCASYRLNPAPASSFLKPRGSRAEGTKLPSCPSNTVWCIWTRPHALLLQASSSSPFSPAQTLQLPTGTSRNPLGIGGHSSTNTQTSQGQPEEPFGTAGALSKSSRALGSRASAHEELGLGRQGSRTRVNHGQTLRLCRLQAVETK